MKFIFQGTVIELGGFDSTTDGMRLELKGQGKLITLELARADLKRIPLFGDVIVIVEFPGAKESLRPGDAA